LRIFSDEKKKISSLMTVLSFMWLKLSHFIASFGIAVLFVRDVPFWPLLSWGLLT